MRQNTGNNRARRHLVAIRDENQGLLRLARCEIYRLSIKHDEDMMMNGEEKGVPCEEIHSISIRDPIGTLIKPHPYQICPISGLHFVDIDTSLIYISSPHPSILYKYYRH